MNIDNEKLNVMLSRIGDIGLRQRVNFIVGQIPDELNSRVLDLGCGEGLYTFTLANSGFKGEIIAFDFNAALLQMASKWIACDEKIKFKNGDITKKLPYEDNYFDVIIFTEVMEHLDDDIEPLFEIRRVLKDGGKLFLTVPNLNFPTKWDPINKIRMSLGLGHFSQYNTILGGVWSYDHKRLYKFEDLEKKLVNSKFKFIKKVSLTHYCLPFNYLILRIGKIVGQLFPASSYSKAIEKFEITIDQEKSLASKIVDLVFKVIHKQYLKNILSEGNLLQSSVSIGGVLIKNDD